MTPILAAEIAFWQKSFALEDWTIEARFVRDLRYPMNACGSQSGRQLLGLLQRYDAEKRTATIFVDTRQNANTYRRLPEIVCHEMIHVLGAGYRYPGWTVEKEHSFINTMAPLLADLKRKNRDKAIACCATFGNSLRQYWEKLNTGQNAP